jgi:hypothetical protein
MMQKGEQHKATILLLHIKLYILLHTLGVNVEVYLLCGQCLCLGWLNIDIRHVDV